MVCIKWVIPHSSSCRHNPSAIMLGQVNQVLSYPVASMWWNCSENMYLVKDFQMICTLVVLDCSQQQFRLSSFLHPSNLGALHRNGQWWFQLFNCTIYRLFSEFSQFVSIFESLPAVLKKSSFFSKGMLSWINKRPMCEIWVENIPRVSDGTKFNVTLSNHRTYFESLYELSSTSDFSIDGIKIVKPYPSPPSLVFPLNYSESHWFTSLGTHTSAPILGESVTNKIPCDILCPENIKT